MAWTYVDGGADSMVTMAANISAFSRWNLRQRVLRGPNPRTKDITLSGTALTMPLAGAPTGLSGLTRWDGEIALARAAEEEGTRLVLSGGGSYSIEEVATATDHDHWFQLYPFGDREAVGRLIRRAQRSGYEALVVTVDIPVVGNREGERLIGMGLPPVLTPRRVIDGALHPRWAYGFLRHRRVSIRNFSTETGVGAGVRTAEEFQRQVSMANLGWDDLAWMRERWPGPFYVKGVLDVADAEQAVDQVGCDGIVVSNHGGRQLDCTPASLDALPAIAASVGGRATILLDGGVRRGSDIVKALCLGADACLVGRPLLYGLGADGRRGVSHVLRILGEELDRTMHLMGCKDVHELDRSWLLPAGGEEPPKQAGS